MIRSWLQGDYAEATRQPLRWLIGVATLVGCGVVDCGWSQTVETIAEPPRTSTTLTEAVPEQPEAPEVRVPTATETRVVPVDGDVSVLEERVRTVLGTRIRLQSGPEPRVYRLTVRGRVAATIIFDSRRAGIVVEGPRKVLDQLDLLLTALQKSSNTTSQRTTVVSIERTDRSRLQQAIEAYRRSLSGPSIRDGSYRERRRPANALALVNFVMQDAAEPAAAPPEILPNETADELQGGLNVDLEVQTLPDLDVIILRGRDRDVSKLTEIIEELERLSRETQPQVLVVPLEHARSEAISEVVKAVNADLTGRRQGRVTVTPLVKPNALLLIGWGDAVKAMQELIAKLDTAVEPSSQFRVYALQHAPAPSLVATLNEFFTNRLGLGARARVVADARSNALIVHAAPRDFAELDQLIKSLDVAQSAAVNRAKVVTLRHALAVDVAQTLRTAIQAASGSTGPSAILEMMTIDSDGERLVRSGILADVRITANARNNSIILSGPAESLPLLETLIEQLDAPGSVSQIKVFRITNGDASGMVRMLRALLPSDATGNVGPQLPSAEGETSLAPLRFSVDTRTNSIIATGTAGDLRIIEALLLRLDERDLAERKNEVYRLRNAPAVDVALAVNEFLRSERIVQMAAPGSSSPFEQIEREVVVVPEPVGNSLIISATPRFFDEIRKLVVDLDRQPPQVLIQVLIAEVVLNNAHEFGVEMGLQDSVLFDRSLLGDLVSTVRTTQTSTAAGVVTQTEQVVQAAKNEPGFLFNNRPLGNSGSNRALAGSQRVGTQGLSHFAVGRENEELGFGGLVLSASSESVSILIRALEESRRLDVLSRPQVRTLDNQPAFIQVGQRVPRIVASNLTQGGLQTNQVELENVGLIMGVTPRISPDDTVVMEIDAEKSSLGLESEGIPITVSIDGTVIRSPRIDTTTAQATVSAASGETIILGGLITNSSQTTSRRVPYLSDIPLLGNLFRYDGRQHRRTELLIIMTPYVIRTPQDSARINQAEMARMSWCAADVYQVHGEIPGSMIEGPIFDEPTEVIYPDVNPRGEPVEPPEPSESFDVPETPARDTVRSERRRAPTYRQPFDRPEVEDAK